MTRLPRHRSHGRVGRARYLVAVLDLGSVLAQLLVVLAATRLAGSAARRVGQPRAVGEIAAGLALGPTGLGTLAPELHGHLFPPQALTPLATLANVGVLLLLFGVGARLDLGALRAHARTAVAVSHASIVGPFVLGLALAPALPRSLAGPTGSPLAFALFLGTALSVTAFPVLATIVEERGLRDTRLGTLALTAAAVDDVTAWTLLAAVTAVARANPAGAAIGRTAVASLALALGAWGARRALSLAARRSPAPGAGAGGAERWLPGALVLLVACAWATERAGLHALFGAFLAGTLLPRRDGLAAAIADRLGDLGRTFLLPAFFALTGLRTQLDLGGGGAVWRAFAALLVAGVVGKLAGSAVAARWAGESWRDALALGALMNTRGLMALVVLTVGLDAGVIAPALFSLMVLVALATTAMTTPLLTRLGVGAGAPSPALP